MNIGINHLSSVLAHFDKKAPHYQSASERWPWSWLRRREADRVFDLLGDVAGARCLDLGCGAGFYTRRLVDFRACQVTAVDNSANMIASLPENDTITSLVCDAEVLKDIGPFDMIVSAGLLEFVKRPKAVLTGARKVIAPDGSLVLLAPVRNIWGRFYACWHASHAVEIRLFEVQELVLLAQESGWQLAAHYGVWPFTLVARLEPI